MCLQVHVPEEQGHAHLFLAQYYLKRKRFLEAEAHAHKCTEFLDVRHWTILSPISHSHFSPPSHAPLPRLVRRVSQ